MFTVCAELLPDASVHSTVIVYTRALPVPERSARRFRVSSPVTSQSGAVSPSPNPSTGSLLLTATIWQAGAYEAESVVGHRHDQGARRGQGLVFIALVLDWYTKKIVGHYVALQARTAHWLAALDAAVNRQFPHGV